jgi:dsRNA-specific ribonuclease
MAVSEIAELETVLGHAFRDPRWLVQALMHSSRIPERTADEPIESNEKLEFLGDAVLELLASEELVRAFPGWSEGQLSKSRARLVNATALSHAAQKSVLQELLQSRGAAPCRYHTVAESGPDHEKTFRVEVRIAGEITAVGTGKTKKEAEQSAAIAALIQLGVAE